MTEENYKYRTSQITLRNQFPGCGKLQIPIIPKFQERAGDFDDLTFIGFDKTHLDDQKHADRMVHFFLYDYRFERVWKHPEKELKKLSKYKAVLSPDFSMYLEMTPVMQIYNVFRNRWCGAFWASKGIRVIPTVNWGDESTFDFCFDGIEKGSAVAVSTYMAQEHGNRQDQREWFMAGYNEMLRRIEPERILCYSTPFPEMQGNIIHVDYELSSWRYLSHDVISESEDLENYKVGCSHFDKCDTMEPYMIGGVSFKGGGSAYGGKWRPNPKKPTDQRFLGKPGEIKRTYKDGYWVDTKIGMDGRAERERHYTCHGRNDKHTNPHDHVINWEEHVGFPMPGRPINYPEGAPEFKMLGGNTMEHIMIVPYDVEQNRFTSISDFKESMIYGGEVEFYWKGKYYGIYPHLQQTPDSPVQMMICQLRIENCQETDKWCDTADEVLDYMVGEDRLRDVVTQVTVLARI